MCEELFEFLLKETLPLIFIALYCHLAFFFQDAECHFKNHVKQHLVSQRPWAYFDTINYVPIYINNKISKCASIICLLYKIKTRLINVLIYHIDEYKYIYCLSYSFCITLFTENERYNNKCLIRSTLYEKQPIYETWKILIMQKCRFCILFAVIQDNPNIRISYDCTNEMIHVCVGCVYA